MYNEGADIVHLRNKKQKYAYKGCILRIQGAGAYGADTGLISE